MALDFNSVKLLLWGKNLGVSFERTVMLGRQGLSCSRGRLRQALRDFGVAATPGEIDRCFQRPPCTPVYANEFFRLLGAKECRAVDRSDFEGADWLHDLNDPFPTGQMQTASLVVDGGTLEHIFNYPAAIRNCMELVRVGGHFLTVPPALNLMGHGFYQFSPELFFRVFSSDNGFAVRKMVLFEFLKTDADFFEVNDPAITGLRSELYSSRPMYLGVLAQRIAAVPILAKTPQQSDYVAGWESSSRAANDPAHQPSGLIWKLRKSLNLRVPYWLRTWKQNRAHARLYGSPRLSNRRHFRPLSYEAICRERVQPAAGSAIDIQQGIRAS